MGRIRKTKRKHTLRRKRERTEKYHRLKAKYQAAKTEEERKQILEKLARLAPFVGIEKWLQQTRKT